MTSTTVVLIEFVIKKL